MINKEKLAKYYCQSWRGDYVAWAAAESGFIAGWEAHQQLLQQTQCTRLRELLSGKVDEIDKVRDRKEKEGLKTEIETGIVLGLKIAFQLIDDSQPVA